MSLINEALKRAKEAQNTPEVKPSASKDQPKVSEATMRPVESQPQQSSSGILALCGALAVVLVGVVVLLWMWSGSQEKNVIQTHAPIVKAETTASPPAPPQAVAPPVAPPTPTPAPVAVAVPEVPLVAAQTEAISTNTVSNTAPIPSVETAAVTNVEPSIAAVPPPAPEPAVPQFPALKLQGIFYNNVKPAAVINGKTYYVGGVVAAARITKIETDKVTVEWNGETRELETAQ